MPISQLSTPLSGIGQVKLSPKGTPMQQLLDKTSSNQPLDLIMQKGQSLSTKHAKEPLTLANHFQEKLKKPYPPSNEQIKDSFSKQPAPIHSIHSTQAILSQTSSPKAMESKKFDLIFQPKQNAKHDPLKNPGTSSVPNNLNNYHGPHPRQYKQGSLPINHVQNIEPVVHSARRNSKPSDHNPGSKPNPIGGPALDLHDILGNFGGMGQHYVRAYHHINLNNMNNYGSTPNNIERGQSPNNYHDVGSHMASHPQYYDIVRNLNDKNQEFDMLIKEKNELKTKMDSLAEELRELKKMKLQINEKDQIIAQLKSDLSQALQNSTDFQAEFQKDPQFRENIENLLKSQNENDPLTQQSVQALLDRFNILSGEDEPIRSEEHSQSRSPDKKSHLLDMLRSQNTNTIPNPQTIDAKRPGSSYLLINTSDSRSQREPLNLQTSSGQNQPYQRSFTPGHNLSSESKQKFETPYSENFVGETKDLGSKNPGVSTPKKQPDSRGNLKKTFQIQQSSSKPISSNINFKKEDLAEALRKNNVARSGSLQLKTDLVLDKNLISMPSSSTKESAGLDVLKRKFSHDPKIVGDQTSNDHDRPLSFRGANPSKKGLEKNFDIATSLNLLKERIGTILERHRNHHISLKRTQDLILEKIEKLTLNQNPKFRNAEY